MQKKFTFWLTLFAVVVCAIHYFGFDYNNLLLYFLSVPVWFIEIFRDIHSMNIGITYLLTIASYTVFGLLVDGYTARRTRGK